MKFYYQPFILSVLIGLVYSQQVDYTDCGPNNLKSMKITPCDNPKLCQMLLTTFVEAEIEFTSPVDSDQVTEEIKGIVRGKELPFPGKKINPCDGHLTPACPVKKGENYLFKAKFEIKPFYPAIPIELKYNLLDSSGNLILCTKVGAIIVSNNPKKPRRKGGQS